MHLGYPDVDGPFAICSPLRHQTTLHDPHQKCIIASHDGAVSMLGTLQSTFWKYQQAHTSTGIAAVTDDVVIPSQCRCSGTVGRGGGSECLDDRFLILRAGCLGEADGAVGCTSLHGHQGREVFLEVIARAVLIILVEVIQLPIDVLSGVLVGSQWVIYKRRTIHLRERGDTASIFCVRSFAHQISVVPHIALDVIDHVHQVHHTSSFATHHTRRHVTMPQIPLRYHTAIRLFACCGVDEEKLVSDIVQGVSVDSARGYWIVVDVQSESIGLGDIPALGHVFF